MKYDDVDDYGDDDDDSDSKFSGLSSPIAGRIVARARASKKKSIATVGNINVKMNENSASIKNGFARGRWWRSNGGANKKRRRKKIW